MASIAVRSKPRLKKLNTRKSIDILDEDCSQIATRGRSDVGEMTTTQEVQTTRAKQSTRITKKERLLSNADVKRWYDNLARASPTTAESRQRKLSQFCEVHNMTPMELVELGMKDNRTATDLLQDHITYMEEQACAPQYIKGVMTAVKSWLDHFNIKPTRRLRIANADSTPTLEDERVPNASELSEILNRADLCAGAAISLIAKAGLRPETLGNHDGSDGLRMKDLPDIAIVQGEARCLQMPVRIIARRTLSKAGHQYFTYLTESGTKKLLAYLNDRLANGEALNADSAVIAPDSMYKTYRGRNNGRRFLPTQRILRKIRETLRPRFGWRPYVFRSYFDTQLLIAESRGKIAHDFRVFFMGHKGSIEAKYTTNKGVLAEELVKEMREAFKRSQEFLDLEVKEEDPILKQKEQIIEAVTKATPEKVQEMLRMLSIGKTQVSE